MEKTWVKNVGGHGFTIAATVRVARGRNGRYQPEWVQGGNNPKNQYRGRRTGHRTAVASGVSVCFVTRKRELGYLQRTETDFLPDEGN